MLSRPPGGKGELYVDPLNLPEFHLDALKEIGNIGAGNAATALSRLLDKPVAMKVPRVNVLPFEQVAESAGGAEEVVIAIYLRVTGDVSGNMFFILSRESAKKLLDSMAGIAAEADDHYSEMEISALMEIGNILVGSYLTSLADLTRLNMHPSVPSLAVDMLGAILSYGLVEFGRMGDRALLIDTKLMEGDLAVEGHFYFIPDPDSFATLFGALGVPTE
jgi:Chemotaxis protein CheC, inhibitor of MCP methylation